MTDWTELDNSMLNPQWYLTDEYREAFTKLRHEDPLHFTHDTFYGKDYWLLTRHEDVRNYFLDHARLSSRWESRIPKNPRRYTPEERYELGFDTSMARNDPPTHTLYRKPINKHFSAPAIGKLTRDIEAIVDEIIADVAERGECELVENIAGELPVKVILRMLGVPESDWPQLRLAAWQWFAPADPNFMIDNDPVATSRHGQMQVMEYCEQLAISRRNDPQDDFATVIGNLTVDGDKLSVHEMRNYFSIMIGGGLETTRNSASIGMWLFMTNPDQRKLLLEDPSLANSAVDEVLRWGTPARTKFRVASEEIQMHGKVISPGDWVIASLASANWDETVFSNPERFDITRNPNPHLTFGEGIHLCLGRYLARLELATLFRKVLQAFPDMELDGTPTRLADISVGGFSRMPVRYTPTHVTVPA